MPTVRIDDVGIYYEAHGPVGHSHVGHYRGLPLVLTYGLGGNSGMWAEQIYAFAQHYRFIAWDPRGHGRSDSPPHRAQYGLQIAAEDLHGLLNHLDIQKAYVGGLSMGGSIAARFALAYPERVAALLIIDSASASGLPIPDAMRALRHKTIELAETQGMAAVADYIIAANPNLSAQADASPATHQRLRRMFLDLNPTGYAHTVRALLEEPFPRERLSALTMPTLILAGETDPALEAARKTHQEIPNSRLVILPEAGHLSNLDRPAAFNATILEFLSQVESATR